MSKLTSPVHFVEEGVVTASADLSQAQEDGRFIAEAGVNRAVPDVSPEILTSEIIQTFTTNQWGSTDPNRPFTGQPHTDQGARGMAYVEGIRFRDVADCLVKAFAQACADPTIQNLLGDKIDNGTLEYKDMYKIDLSQIDPTAVIQNLTCNIERVMGIFPNLPDLKWKSLD